MGPVEDQVGAPRTPPRRNLRQARRWAPVVVLVLVALLVVAQITLPAIASSRLRSRLSDHGPVQLATVSAFPAIELLWGHSDSVTVRMSSYSDAVAGSGAPASGASTSRTKRLANLLASTGKTGSLDARIGVLHSGHLVLENVVLTKSGDRLSATALLTNGNLQAALPTLFTLKPLQSPSGELLFKGTVRLALVKVSAVARLRARHGALVVQPDIVGLFPSFLSLTVFSDPRIRVDSVSERAVSGGWEVFASAELVG
jgi:hypothetical protein